MTQASTASTPQPFSHRLSTCLIAALIALVPLFVSSYFDHPYREAKFFLIWIIVSFAAFSMALHPIVGLSTKLERILGIYISAIFLSIVGAIHLGRATEYAFEQLALLALLPLGAAWLSNPAGRKALLWLLISTTGIVALVALGQDAGLITWGVDTRWPYPSSTLGFKNLAGQIYLLGGIIAFASMLHPSTPKPLRLLSGAVLVLALWGVWSVRARSCALGLGLGVGVLGLLYLKGLLGLSPKHTWKAPALGALLAATLVTMSFSAGPGMEQKREKRAPTDASTLNTRFIRWSNSFDVWLDHPITGVGLGNFRVHYPKYGQTDPQQNERMNVHEAHNEFLQILVECGLIGLLAWLAFLSCLFIGLFKQLQSSNSQEHRLFTAALLAALTGILAHTFFSFALRNPAPPVWCWLSIGAALGSPRKPSEGWPQQLRTTGWFVFGISTLTWALWTGHTSHLTHQGVRAMGQKQLPQAIEFFTSAAQHPNADRALLKLCYAHGKFGQREQAITACKRAAEKQPYNPIVHDQLARQYHGAGQLKAALSHYDKTLELQPAFKRARVERDKVQRLLKQRHSEKKGWWDPTKKAHPSPDKP